MCATSAGAGRLPVILMIDASEGMSGVFQVTLQQGLESLCQELRQDDQTSRMVYLATIVCASDGASAQRLSAITRYQPPAWEASGPLALAAGLDHVSSILRFGLIHQRPEVGGDYAPLIIYALASPPTDDWAASLDHLRALAAQYKALSIALVTSDSLVAPARELAARVVAPGHEDPTYGVQIGEPDGAMMTAFFEWMTEVIATIGGNVRSGQHTLSLPPLPHGLVAVA